jgi:5,10-methylenetetrahydromethanopterin reductase
VKTKFSVMLNGIYSMHEIPALARQIEAYGFDEFHVADDLLFRPAWPLLALAARETNTIKLGPFIVTPQLAHPVYHASNLAALDELSGGRAIGGIGRGGLNSLVGIEKPRHPVRFVREGLELMRHVLAGKQQAFNGEFFHAQAELVLQYPIPRPDVPLYIGSWGPQMARMAGSVAAGVKADCVADPNYLRQLKTALLDGAKAAERPADEVTFVVGPLCSIANDRAHALRSIRELLALLQPFLSPMVENLGLDSEAVGRAAERFDAGDHDGAVALVSDAAVAAFSLTGTPADIIPRIESLIDAGADNIAFGTPLGPDPNEALRLLATQVLPYFH